MLLLPSLHPHLLSLLLIRADRAAQMSTASPPSGPTPSSSSASSPPTWPCRDPSTSSSRVGRARSTVPAPPRPPVCTRRPNPAAPPTSRQSSGATTSRGCGQPSSRPDGRQQKKARATTRKVGCASQGRPGSKRRPSSGYPRRICARSAEREARVRNGAHDVVDGFEDHHRGENSCKTAIRCLDNEENGYRRSLEFQGS